MDTMAALALATEAPTPELLERKPYGRTASIVTRTMWRNIIGQATFQLGALFFLLYSIEQVSAFGLPSNRARWTEEHEIIHTTIVFNSFVLCQLFNELNSRKLGNEMNILSGIFTNTIFLGVMAFTIVVQFIIVQFGGDFAQTRALNGTQWMGCLIIGALSIPWGVMLRLIPITEPEPVRQVSPAKEQSETEKKKHLNHLWLMGMASIQFYGLSL